jgi:hypothetical protein
VHLDIVSWRAPGAVVLTRPGLDGNRQCRTDRFAQLACDATFLTAGIPPQRMFAAKVRRQRRFFKRVVQRRLRFDEVAHRQKNTDANSDSNSARVA